MATEIHSPFPDHRRQDPKRRAEARVYDTLVTCVGRNGHALYEFRYRDVGQQVDYAVWLHCLGRFAIQVKGGHYEMSPTGEWYLVQPGGSRLAVPPPLDEAADGAMEMRNAIIEVTTFKNFVAPVLLFPDMEEDTRIEQAARNSASVYVVWGLDNLEEDLERIAVLARFRRPPRSRISENECLKLRELQYSGSPAPDGQRQGAATGVHPEPVEGLDDRQVIIQHVEHLHIHTPTAPEMPLPPGFRPGG